MAELSKSAVAWRVGLESYLNTHFKHTGAQQLKLMTLLYDELGLEVPQLSAPQLDNINQNAEANPKRRLLPVPLGTLALRGRLVDPDPDSKLHELLRVDDETSPNRDHAVLWTPAQMEDADPDQPWHKLWKPGIKATLAPDKIFAKQDGRADDDWQKDRRFGLRYKDSRGHMVTRGSLVNALVRRGEAIPDTERNVWTFPFVDINGIAPSNEAKLPSDIYEKQSYIISPEALIILQAIHFMAGKPIDPEVAHIGNETITQLQISSVIRGFTTVSRSSQDARFEQRWVWNEPAVLGRQVNGINGLTKPRS